MKLDNVRKIIVHARGKSALHVIINAVLILTITLPIYLLYQAYLDATHQRLVIYNYSGIYLLLVAAISYLTASGVYITSVVYTDHEIKQKRISFEKMAEIQANNDAEVQINP